MSIFRRKEKDRRLNTDNTTVRLPAYGPHDTLQPQDYMIPYKYFNFEETFPQSCKTWLQNTGNVDRYNYGYMDSVIREMENDAMEMLALQSVDHHAAIYELTKIWVGDRIKAEARLQAIQEEREEIRTKLEHLKRIYNQGTSLAEESK